MGSFETPEGCAREVQGIAAVELTARPWNRFDLDDLWWLIPSKQWPAYRHGKLTFTRRHADPGELFLGINVEKGFGQMAAAAFPSLKQNQLLKPDWTWHRLVSEDGARGFERAVADLPVELNPRLVVYAILVQDPSGYDPYNRSQQFKMDRAIFGLADDRTFLQESDLQVHLLDSIARDGRLSEVITALKSLPQSDWVWIDVYAGIRVRGNSQLSIGEVYRRTLSKFTPWLV